MSNNEVYENGSKTRKWVMAMPLGAGYRYKIAPNTYAYGMILYDVLQDKNSTNKNPIIRVVGELLISPKRSLLFSSF